MSLGPKVWEGVKILFLVRIPSASVEGSASGSASVKFIFHEMSKIGFLYIIF